MKFKDFLLVLFVMILVKGSVSQSANTTTQDPSVRIAVLQAGENNYKNGNPGLEANFCLFDSLAREASKAKPDLIVFPEYAISGWKYPKEEIINSIAESVPGNGYWYTRYVKLAKEVGVPVLGWIVDTEGGKLYNTAFILDENGKYVGKYHKVHANLGEQTWWGWSQGNSLKPILLHGVNYGISICADMWFPETVRCEELMGANVIVHLSISDDMQHLVPARAFDSNIPIVMAIFRGGSYAVDSRGNLMEKLPSETSEWRIFELNPFELRTHSKYGGLWIPKLGQRNLRNVDTYSILTDPETRPDWSQVFLDEEGNQQSKEQLLVRFRGRYDEKDPKKCIDSVYSLNKVGRQWFPCVEWELYNSSYLGNPFDVSAEVTFTHKETDETKSTGMFFDGDSTWKFRFTGILPGEWNFLTSSDDPELDKKEGKVTIYPNHNPKAHGFMKNFGTKWGWQGTEDAFVPQYVMYRDDPKEYYKNPELINQDVQKFIVEHGFTGFHVPSVAGTWFDMDCQNKKVTAEMENPDPRTFAALELLITRVHAAGGSVAFWIWGDHQREQTCRSLARGPNGTIDNRLQQYIAARLGPLPGWIAGFGFDLDEWAVEPDIVKPWYDCLQSHLGWDHFLGARPEGPNSSTDHSAYTEWNQQLDYSSYEHHRPNYDVYFEAINNVSGKPCFSEDRFRVRGKYPEKDYDEEMTRRGLYISTMAGGAANIWGYLLKEDSSFKSGGLSFEYPNKEWIKTYSVFFSDCGRFIKDMIPANHHSDGYCLKSELAKSYIFYKEDSETIVLDLSELNDDVKAVAVDTKKEYHEIEMGQLKPVKQKWEAPYKSDWIIGVGGFNRE